MYFDVKKKVFANLFLGGVQNRQKTIWRSVFLLMSKIHSYRLLFRRFFQLG